MQTICIDQIECLADYRTRWDELAGGNVFRSWTWTTTWWKHYGENNRHRTLRVVCALDDQRQPLAILPCYVEQSLPRGRVWRLCGDGEVCSDHVGLLIAADSDRALDALGEQMASRDDWDLLDLAPIDAADRPTQRLADKLRESGCNVGRTEGPATWEISLPATWDDYLGRLSKTHRKKFRRLESRLLETGLVQWHVVQQAAEFDAAWNTFEQLHRLRWESLGQRGCLGSPQWQAFHRDVARQLLDEGRLRLAWLTYDGQPLAAEYQFVGDQTVYAYQGGLAPELMKHHPGRLAHLCATRLSIEEGRRVLDLLRGDEPYKQHYRAEAQPTYRLQTTPPRRLAQWRHWACTSVVEAGRLAKRCAGLLS